MRARSSIVLTLCLVTGLALMAPVSASAADPHLRGQVTRAGSAVPGVCVDIHPAGSLAEQATYVTGSNGRWAASPGRPSSVGGPTA